MVEMGNKWPRADNINISITSQLGSPHFANNHRKFISWVFSLFGNYSKDQLSSEMGFRLNLKWGSLSLHSPLSTSPSSRPSSYSCRGRDSSHGSVTLSTASPVFYCEPETRSDVSRAPQISESCYLGTREPADPENKVALVEELSDSLFDNENRGSNDVDDLAYLTGLQSTQASQYRILMKNIETLEGTFADSNALRLERDILEQLERFGALRLFHSCLSGTTLKPSIVPNEIVEEPTINDLVDNHLKVFVRSGKKEIRKSRRNRKNVKESVQKFSSEISPSDPTSLPLRRNSRSRSKRRKIAKNEAEMSSGVKMVSELEKLKVVLEEETCQVASLSCWAEAAGLEKKELLQRLHYGWNCRDELVRSTRSLVVIIAKNYKGLGVPFEDLVQAGNTGVLQGAERFDQTRGYKFSTYVVYWIRKSMSTLVSRHARGIRIPCTLSKVINQVMKAREALRVSSNGKYPDDCEIGKLTGLSMAKITSASLCLRVVGSIDRKVAEDINIKYMETTPDTSIQSPEEAVCRQHVINDIYALVNALEPREKQVIILRFGLGNNQRKSLEEIGKIFSVSKEWIRRIERSALNKLRNEECLKI